MASLMQRMNAVFGGEGNGGIMNPDVHIGRDSLVGSVMLLQLLSEWRNEQGRFSPDHKAVVDEEDEEEDGVGRFKPAPSPVLPADKKDRTISALHFYFI